MEGNSDVSSASTLEAQPIGETGGERASTATGDVKQNTAPFLSQSDTHKRAVWLFDERNVSGNLQMVKKVVVSKDQYKDYIGEIRQSYELGFTPFRLRIQ